MVNEVVLVGKLKKIESIDEFKKQIYIEVDRPFKDTYNRLSDIFKCVVWDSVFSKITNYSKIGDLLAIKGRIQLENDEYLIMSENIVLLNKSKEYINKIK